MSDRVRYFLDTLSSSLQLDARLLDGLVAVELLVLAVAVVLGLRYAKFFGYLLRNARRNLLRSLLTVGSITISLFLMMFLMSFLAMLSEAANSVRDSRRVITLSSQGFAQPVPIALVSQAKTIEGVVAASPLSWFGGNYQEEVMPFAQFGVDAETIFTIYDEFTVPPEQLEAFKQDRQGCVIGTKLAEDRNLAVGDALPLKGTIYPFDLNLTIRAIYDGPPDSDRRTCWFHWDFLEEGLKRTAEGRFSGNAGAIVMKCATPADVPEVIRRFDAMNLNSDTPTRTQTEEAFVRMFLEMWGDVRGLIRNVGIAVVFSLICVAGNAMAMSLRERTTEIAVLRAIGFNRPLVVSLMLIESVLVAAVGGLLGAIGTKLLFDAVDIARYMAQFATVFYVPWPIALFGFGAAMVVGFASGLFPALRAARLSVIDGLRKVV